MVRCRRSALGCALLGLLLAVLAGCSDDGSRDAGPDISPARLDREVRDALAANPYADTIRAVLVYHDDQPFLTDYRDTTAAAYRDVEWVTKSVLSALVGIAIHDGSLTGVNQALGDLLPRYRSAMPPWMRHETLEDLLTMTAGLARVWWGVADPTLAFMADPDPVLSIIRAADERPGRFAYSSGSAHLVAAVLEQATGRPLLDYAREKLFGPLGIPTRPAAQPLAAPANVGQYLDADFAWPVDRRGLNTGWGLLKLRPVDMAALGLLYLHRGRWDGRQVVPAAWVRESTAMHVRTDRLAPGYGYFWWVGHADGAAAYMAVGFGGQLVEVVPAKDLVVIFSTDFDLRAPTTAGVHEDLLITVVDDLVAPHFPSR